MRCPEQTKFKVIPTQHCFDADAFAPAKTDHRLILQAKFPTPQSPFCRANEPCLRRKLPPKERPTSKGQKTKKPQCDQHLGAEEHDQRIDRRRTGRLRRRFRWQNFFVRHRRRLLNARAILSALGRRRQLFRGGGSIHNGSRNRLSCRRGHAKRHAGLSDSKRAHCYGCVRNDIRVGRADKRPDANLQRGEH